MLNILTEKKKNLIIRDNQKMFLSELSQERLSVLFSYHVFIYCYNCLPKKRIALSTADLFASQIKKRITNMEGMMI